MADTNAHRRAVIEKLERLAENSTFVGEAEAAREKAHAMRVQYGIFSSPEIKNSVETTSEKTEIHTNLFRISNISEEDMNFYLRAIQATANQPMTPPGIIEWNAEIITKKSFFSTRKIVTMLIRFSSESLVTLNQMQNYFLAFGELEISKTKI